ncbi:hypothetical protein TrST_g5432 [Triparma strigata]|uniref:Uncharacterized protein n=1 Tax=Triparma strigata TaxID=1606541 RepID=A0A9W7AI77_9STRA|nr:hypothetical protein TrST_g5432 [Triparma strigata]
MSADMIPNPLHEIELEGLATQSAARPVSSKDSSEKNFKQRIKDEATKLETGKNLGEVDAVNQDAIRSILSGEGAGGVFEMISIAISFFQNFGLIFMFEIPWPDSFKRLFSWLQIFSFDFEAFGGDQLGIWSTIWAGLLVPLWLILMFNDAGRKRFGAPWFTREGDLHTNAKCGVTFWFSVWGTCSTTFIILAIEGAKWRWYASDAVDALLLVLSGLFFLYFLYHNYLFRLLISCDKTKEDFGKTRQHSEMFLFVFLYSVAYLSGVSACVKMIMMDDFSVSLVGFGLLPLYLLYPIFHLFCIGLKVKKTLSSGDIEEGGGAEGYKEKLDFVQVKALEEVAEEHVKLGKDRMTQQLDESESGYEAAVASTLLGSFEEKFWWWKLFLMAERAALAISVHTGAPSLTAIGISGSCWFMSLYCRPYWSRAEDWLDIMVRLTTFLTCLSAGLLEFEVIEGKEMLC